MARGLEEKLGLIVMKNCEEQGKKIEETIKKKRNTNEDYIIPISQDRFNNGEGKVMINATVRDKDLYILSDIGNHSITYDMFGYKNHMGPDEHYQDIERVISAARGQAERITVVMPLLYESRQLGGSKEFTPEQVERLYEIRRQMGMKGKHPANLCTNVKAGKPSCHSCGGSCSCGDGKADAALVSEITKKVLEQLGL